MMVGLVLVQIQKSLFLMLVLQFTASTGSYYSYVTVRNGDDAILPCENLIYTDNKCNSTMFLFSGYKNSETVELITHGQNNEKSNSKLDRLSVTENCSLVIKKVTDEDVGRYTCRQFVKTGGPQQGPDYVVDLSAVTMTEHKDNNEVTLSCSVSKHEHCGHTVKWLFDGNKNDFTDLKTSQHFCSVTATFPISHLNQMTCSESLKCEVTDARSKNVQQFIFRSQCSGEDAKITATTKSPITETTVTVTNKESTTNKRNPTKAEDAMTRKSTTTKRIKLTPSNLSETMNSDSKNKQEWLRSILVSLGLAALIISVVTVHMWTRTKGNKTQTEDNTVDNDEGEG